jgi:branched-subunit amino acid transport protein
MNLVYIAVYVFLCVLVAYYGRGSRLGFWGLLLLTPFVTPWIVFIGLVLLSPFSADLLMRDGTKRQS